MSPDRPSLEGLRIDRSQAPRSPVLTPSRLLALIAVLAIAAALTWWFPRTKPIPVRTAAAREIAAGEPTTLLNASGYVTARRLATISSKITGKIIEVLVEEGTQVEPGQILARIDASNAEAALRLAEAQLEVARQALAETDANLAPPNSTSAASAS